MTALTKSEMADLLHERLGLNKREAKELVEQFFEEIRLCLENNEQVKLSGFGNFDLRDKRQRPGRNPKTGEEIPILARRVVTFKAGQKLKELLLPITQNVRLDGTQFAHLTNSKVALTWYSRQLIIMGCIKHPLALRHPYSDPLFLSASGPL